jgi:hypothetical protein
MNFENSNGEQIVRTGEKNTRTIIFYISLCLINEERVRPQLLDMFLKKYLKNQTAIRKRTNFTNFKTAMESK